MRDSAKLVINQALELSAHERAIIAEQLLFSLDRPDTEVDKIWAREAEARLDALERGKISTVPADSVLGKNNQ